MPSVCEETLDGIFIGKFDPKIPNKHEWPISTHVACWYCAHKFDTQPIPIVQNYEPQRAIYFVIGATCSGSCARGYLMRENSAHAQQLIIWQRQMLVDVFGMPHNYILPPAKPLPLLQLFGGPMTIEEWRGTTGVMLILSNSSQLAPYRIGVRRYVAGEVMPQPEQDEEDAQEKALAEALDQIGQENLTTLPGVKRPDTIISTREQLEALYPEVAVNGQKPSVFENWLRTQQPPTDEECEAYRAKLHLDRMLSRKRKHPLPADIDKSAPASLVQRNAAAAAAAAAASAAATAAAAAAENVADGTKPAKKGRMTKAAKAAALAAEAASAAAAKAKSEAEAITAAAKPKGILSKPKQPRRRPQGKARFETNNNLTFESPPNSPPQPQSPSYMPTSPSYIPT
jgi:hypothetical protein